MSDHDLTVDDLVTGNAAAQLGEGRIPCAAILIVETMSDDGIGMRYVLSEGMRHHQAIGLLRSVLIKVEHDALEAWESDD